MKLASAALVLLASASAASAVENRCGWFVNPTPANAWLTDSQGQWIIGTQGGQQADGEWPDIRDWVATNGSYGYGCTCMRVTTNSREKRILVIHSTRPLPLSKCRNDAALPAPE